METAANQAPAAETSGGQGERVSLDLTRPADMATTRRAIKKDWPIRPSLRRLVVDTMAGLLESAEEERTIVAAAKVLIEADKANLKRREVEKPAAPASPIVIQIASVRHELLNDAQYLEFLRIRAGEGHGDAGPVRALGQPG